MEPPVVKDNVAGSILINIDTIRRRLGLTAFDVWVSFLWRRNREGHTFASTRSVARYKNLPYTSVRRACGKLCELYFIKESKWVLGDNGKKRFRRTILGDYRNGIITIPDITYARISSKSEWGGARKGAGRPYNEAPPKPSSSTYNQVGQSVNDSSVRTYIQDGTSIIQVGRTLKSSIKRYKDYITLKGNIMSAESAPVFSSFLSTCDNGGIDMYEEAPPVRLESPVIDFGVDSDPNYPATRDRLLEAPSDDSPEKPIVQDKKQGDTMKDNEPDRRNTYIQVSQGVNPSNGKSVPMMPPYPSVGFIGVPKVPPPPLLSDDLSDEDCVKKLGGAYRGAFESRYGKRSYVMTRGSVKKGKFYKSLVTSANFMRDNEIAPAAWAAFSLDCWISFGEKNEGANKKPPPVNWLFSMKRLEERAGWFDREASSYGGGRLLFTRSHKDLLRKYEGLKRAAHKELLTEELIEKFFPGGWEKHYDSARKEAAADQARLRDIVRRGEFVW